MTREEQDTYFCARPWPSVKKTPTFTLCRKTAKLFEELKANGWDLTRNNLELAFETLKEQRRFVPLAGRLSRTNTPGTNPGIRRTQPVYIDGAMDPRMDRQQLKQLPLRDLAAYRRDYGIRCLRVRPPRPRKKKYTRADIERMSRADYNEKLRSGPEFRRQVDAMPDFTREGKAMRNDSPAATCGRKSFSVHRCPDYRASFARWVRSAVAYMGGKNKEKFRLRVGCRCLAGLQPHQQPTSVSRHAI